MRGWERRTGLSRGNRGARAPGAGEGASQAGQFRSQTEDGGPLWAEKSSHSSEAWSL